MLVRRLHRRRRALRLPLGLLPLMLLVLLAVQRLARAIDWQPLHVVELFVPLAWSEAQARQKLWQKRGEQAPLMFTIPPDMDRRRPWLSYTLTGIARHDTAVLRLVTKRLIWGERHPSERVDIRIDFGSDVRYATVVAALDAPLQIGLRGYALDLYRPTPALYIFARRGLWDKHDRPW